jgi:hypothetical protein
MYPHKLSSHSFNAQYQTPRPTAAPRETPAEDPRQTVVLCQEPVAQRLTRYHITGYTRELSKFRICRCANPGSHGDAYSLGSSFAAWDGIRCFDLQGLEIDW